MDPASLKLGKLPVRHDPRTLRLARYLTPELPPPPAACDWTKGVANWPMNGNAAWGDCTIATAAHLVHAWRHADEDVDQLIPEPCLISTYLELTDGYDSGLVELDVLKRWRSAGICGDRIDAFAALQPRARDQVRQAVHLFGGVYAGVALPLAAQRQAVWDVRSICLVGADRRGSWGGHAIPILGYDAEGLTCVTWGRLQRLTWRWWRAYADEAYALVSPDWTGADGRSPVGLDLAALRADLASVTG